MKRLQLSCDIISTLPPCIIETILCLVPIKEAARTSILSKEWRYKWTTIPKLVFNDNMFKESSENKVSVSKRRRASEREKMGKTKRCKFFNAIYQVLLMRQGPIHEFTLHMKAYKTCLGIDQIISYLSRNNTLKKLKLDLSEENRAYYRLPLSVFSLHHLTELHISDCNLDVQPTFSGFARLTTLYLQRVYISMETLLHILSNSPGLKRFSLIMYEEDLIGDDDSIAIELFECLPVIEHLHLNTYIAECFAVDSVPQELPTSLVHLKCFSMSFVSLDIPDDLRFLALLMRSSPNLEEIKLMTYGDTISKGCIEDGTAVSVICEAYSDIKLQCLNKLKIDNCGDLKAELEFLKFILAKSPKLKKLSILLVNDVTKDEKLEMLRILLHSPHASSMVDIIVKRNPNKFRSLVEN